MCPPPALTSITLAGLRKNNAQCCTAGNSSAVTIARSFPVITPISSADNNYGADGRTTHTGISTAPPDAGNKTNSAKTGQ